MSAERSVFIPNKWNLSLCLFFAAVFVFAIPWGEFTEFSDLKHYVARLEYLSRGGNERNFSGLQWVSSEIVWKAILLGIIDNVNSESYSQALLVISFITLSGYLAFCSVLIRPWQLMVLCFCPMFMFLVMEQLRSGLSFVLLLMAYRRPSLKYVLCTLAVLIHTSCLVIIAVFVLGRLCYRKIPNLMWARLAIALAAVFFALVLKYDMLAFILEATGDRRSIDDQQGQSFLFSSFWGVAGIVLILTGRSDSMQNWDISAVSIFFSVLLFIGGITGVFSQRFLATILPLVVTAIVHSRDDVIRNLTVLGLLLFNVVAWLYWLDLLGT